MTELSASPKRIQIASLVGEEAAAFAYRASRWFKAGYLAVLPTAPALAIASSVLHQPALWGVIGAGVAFAVYCVVRGQRLDNRAGAAASAFLSQRAGLPVKVKSGGIRIWAWQKEIQRGTRNPASGGKWVMGGVGYE